MGPLADATAAKEPRPHGVAYRNRDVGLAPTADVRKTPQPLLAPSWPTARRAPSVAAKVLGKRQGWTEQFPNREIDESRVDMPAVNLPVSNDMMALTVLSLSLLPVP